jgi:hypothetical protein
MNVRQLTTVALVMWLHATIPTAAMPDGSQVLSGACSVRTDDPLYTAPGGLWEVTQGWDEEAAQLRLPAGVLSQLRVRVVVVPNSTPGPPPVRGRAQFMVRVNGADTVLACHIGSSDLLAGAGVGRVGHCETTAVSVGLTGQRLLSIKISNGLRTRGGGTRMRCTYSLVFN